MNDGDMETREPKWSKDGRDHPAAEPDWITERFTAFLTCQNRECGEIFAVSGMVSVEEEIDYEIGHGYLVPFYQPCSVYPGPAIFPIPDECPSDVESQLKAAFQLFWSDRAASANRLRVAIEDLLTDLGVKRFVITSARKRERLKLHDRIVAFEKKDHDAAQYLFAIKWLGNTGSHGDLDELSDDDLLSGFEFMEQLLDSLYTKRASRLMQAARDINRRKGKRR